MGEPLGGTREGAQRDSRADLLHSARASAWVGTMAGTASPEGIVLAHGLDGRPRATAALVPRQAREDAEQLLLSPGATKSLSAGARARPEPPDPLRTCFERDRDRILHSSAFRRLAGKTQVFVFPHDHQRTRLTHALEVAQVATAVARATGLNVALTEAIALGHDCGHGPGGHASEEAFTPFLPEGYNHAVWGADVVLTPLNLCAETLDGIRHHSWSLPSPATPEGAVVSWADRCAYCAHDLEDAASVGIVSLEDLPESVAGTVGRSRSSQLGAFINALVDCIATTGEIGMRQPFAGALAALREFNYERIYTRPTSIAQGQAVIAVLSALVEFFEAGPARIPGFWPSGRPGGSLGLAGSEEDAAVRAAIAYVSGMTDRFAFSAAVELLGWERERLPRGIDASGRSF
ncbi:MAG TPA: HD domain-containing protein [Acidimicrobiales bacterium]|nr:HD domain-containing protein [Acidimicrobiales bacterium]